MALIEKLNAIGDAIRGKTGGTEKLTLEQMPTEIAGITTGSGDIEIEPIVLSGSCSSTCAGSLGTAIVKHLGIAISTKDITAAVGMFQNNMIEYIPFDINFSNTATSCGLQDMFNGCKNLKELPKMLNARPYNYLYTLFCSCYNLRHIPDNYFDTWVWDKMINSTSTSYRQSSIFDSCYSLRSMPLAWMKNLIPKASNTSSVYYGGFNRCYCLDEIVNLPIPYTTVTWTSNAFNTTFEKCSRLKRLTFEANEDGTPIIVNWKNQTIDLTQQVGWCENKNNILNYNSGITADKEVKDDATYQALKNDPDWFTTIGGSYSRYNHNSAVETINSLPDTMTYLAANGGTNTIKFKGMTGKLTDGGAVNTLTEEEIAVAAAKGWTVSFA